MDRADLVTRLRSYMVCPISGAERQLVNDAITEIEALRECVSALAADDWPWTSVKHQEKWLDRAEELVPRIATEQAPSQEAGQ